MGRGHRGTNDGWEELTDERWAALEEVEKVVVGLLALAGDDVPVSTLVKALRLLEMRRRKPSGQTSYYYDKDIPPLLDALHARGYLHRQGRRSPAFRVHAPLLPQVLFRLSDTPVGQGTPSELPSVDAFYSRVLKHRRPARGKTATRTPSLSLLDVLYHVAAASDCLGRAPDAALHTFVLALARRDVDTARTVLGGDRWTLVERGERVRRRSELPLPETIPNRLSPAARARAEVLLGDALTLHDATARLLYARVYALPWTHELARDLELLQAAAAEDAQRPKALRVAPYVRRELARALLLRGEVEAARAAIEPLPADSSKHALLAWAALATPDLPVADRAAQALEHAKAALKRFATPAIDGPERLLTALARYMDPKGPRPRRRSFTSSEVSPIELHGAWEWVARLERLLRTGSIHDTVEDDDISDWGDRYGPSAPAAAVWSALAAGVVSVLSGDPEPVESGSKRFGRKRLTRTAQTAGIAGWTWVAQELDALAVSAPAARAEASPPRRDVPTLAALFPMTPAWELRLQRLEKLVLKERPAASRAAKGGAEKPSAGAKRLVWVIPKRDLGYLDVEPREQSLSKRGTWSKGRKVALKRLYGRAPEYPLDTPEDRAVAAAIEREGYLQRGYMTYEYHLDSTAALDALLRHPLVFWSEDVSQPLAIRKVMPRLEVTRRDDGFHLHVVPTILSPGLSTHVAGPYELEVVVANQAHVNLARVLESGLVVPLDAPAGRAAQAARLEALVAAAADVIEVASDVGLDAQGDASQAPATDLPADPTPVFQLSLLPRSEEGLQVRVRVRPLGPDGPALRPGRGAKRLLVKLPERGPASTERDLDRELARAAAAVEACPTLEQGYQDADGEWVLPGLDTALAFLEELGAQAQRDAQDGAPRVEWPHGEPLRVVGRATPSSARLRVRGGGARAEGWFTVTGQWKVDEDLTVELGELLDLAAATPSRFVPLDATRYLALTDSLRRHLAILSRVGERRGKGLALHPWAAPLAEPLLDEVEAAQGGDAVRAVKAWGAHLRARRAAAQAPVEVPSTLQATLRDYQREGFTWMVRLARLGAGACLADDMGLGKTVQTLALLLTRAQAGPQLVVCPSSVVGVWLSEAARFAPTLNVSRFGPGDRRAAVEEAGPFDVLVASYGLLQSEGERLASRVWETAVLDEAQAIKNPDTQRAKAAFALRAGFRVALTGTPVENRLDELWSIWRFLAPGMLGSRRSFQARFARPIEERRAVGQDAALDPAADVAAADARVALRRLVRPMLLRRMKSQVLDELPPRTEVEILVEPTPREVALYEAVRRRALEGLAQDAHAGNAGQRHLRVLAEITRLRQAACHPSLVLGDDGAAAESDTGAPPAGSKLEAFGELVDELLAGGHRALVFSQFVRHLALVRRWLDARGVSYQYLDGGTPTPQRDARVRAFQGGEGALFLISLRAGGTGLNLTAADYVIHLDPWWNPAVEDQASDRAHRIGQQRPVTIARLLTRGTIEERVLALHRHKRRLAEDLLTGADAAAKLDIDALLALLEA